MRSPDSVPRSQPRREALLRAAMEVVAERGVAGVTHRAVTERAGVPLATASYYFPSIDDLVFEALRRFAEQRTEKLGELLAKLTAARASPQDKTRALLAELSELPKWERLAFFEILCNAPRSERIAQPARAAVDCYLDTIRAAMSTMDFAQDSAEVRAILALGIGYGVLRLAHPDFDDADWLFEAIWDLHTGHTAPRADD